ncbi:galactose ABC transporter substrate-binding protein [Fusibacter ferrireducens]|uniref:D-galactose/methyl-galactoside binding periplasmic protein MglB n=1 Tax=Fusibacter ferrireducens TaxID=2785058 RepID=A0ABS0A104_9FIRM|nr:galactose ABC transporter substrate-binding protein [Fusibacter ferrireducens]MBF4695896.1 galactose/glucose ABC transporter substrate-binding protein MglB [Fusibacter ferrireducens]
MKRRAKILLIMVMMVVASACVLTACGAKSASGEEKPVIGVILYKYDDTFMSFVRKAIEASNHNSATIEMKDSQSSQTMQNDQVDTMIANGVKALAINLVDTQSASTIIEKARAADLPVVFFNKEPEASALSSYDKAWYVGTTSAEAGIIQGEMMAKMWHDNPFWDKNFDGIVQYVLLKGEQGHPDAEARTQYALEAMANKGLMLEALELKAGRWESEKGKSMMEDWIAKHGDAIELVISNNDNMALGAIESLTAHGYFDQGQYMPVFGVDALPDALEQIKAGKMAGTVLNDAKNQGKATFELTYNVAMGREPLDGTNWKFDENKAIRVPYVAVTIDNIKFAAEAYK